MKTVVELRAAKIPIVGFIAVHYWYVIIRGNQKDRWEVWQTQSLSEDSWGHLHKNLMPSENGVGNGESWGETIWTDTLANKLAKTIENSPIIYPYNYSYRYFPGPNSNTYIKWILKQANCDYRLSIKGIGQHY